MLSPAEVSPDYFTTGFPYQKDEYLSYAGTVWAVMGLLTALPQTSHLQFRSRRSARRSQHEDRTRHHPSDDVRGRC